MHRDHLTLPSDLFLKQVVFFSKFVVLFFDFKVMLNFLGRVSMATVHLIFFPHSFKLTFQQFLLITKFF